MEELLEALRAKDGKVYTPMQFRIWAEMIIAGIHACHDEPLSLQCCQALNSPLQDQ